ncbi:dnaJ homolog subfamily C member 10 [Trichonephila clavata]|uniref:DnaJ homolog subfamily C member 10 n=1 Tax=Trichonephila clavata TaxID=2740835 RepID=A0A8X6M0J7_TRICU|nr:dnaJ homolog subfamily C member 10 [Trichonephila clavata]
MRLFIFYLLSILATVNSIDYYELLGVSKDADNREIRRAFKKLALKYHPDKNMGEDKAHEQFITINKAYELDYYYENFGIYDDDPEIITLTKADFVQTVLESEDLWFVNFYSPQCSHCHDLAPTWRELARKFEGVVRFGAVNCEEDLFICRQQNIYSYPSLILYPQREKYHGSRDFTSLAEYVIHQMPYNVIKLTYQYFDQTVSMEEFESNPWLIVTCKDSEGCIDSDALHKLSVMLENLVNVAEVNKMKDRKVCELIDCHTPISYYFNLSANDPKEDRKRVEIEEVDFLELLKIVLAKLPEPESLSEETFKEMRIAFENSTTLPRLLYFAKNKEESSEANVNMKRLEALLPDINVGVFDCQQYPAVCSSLYLRKIPTYLLFKPGGSYEFHYGRQIIHDVAKFARDALSSQVHTLTPEDFPEVTKSSQLWFIDFFAPWCPPCMQLLAHWRKASESSGHLVKFGTVDCSTHISLCRQYNINAYPTTILYNHSVPIRYHGSHAQDQIEEFVEDILFPTFTSLSPTTFESLVKGKSKNEIWVIDFFVPWCGPCQRLAPQWRKLGKMLARVPSVRIGQVDCQAHSGLCHDLGIDSYPTIRLYPRGVTGISRFSSYNDWNRDAPSIQAWIYNFLPSKVHSLNISTYRKVLNDENPWLIDYYVPWCSHCRTFNPVFEKIALVMEDRVKAGKINCDEFPKLCQLASVHAYPTVMFYEGKKDGHSQDSLGIEIHGLTFDGIYSFLEAVLKRKSESEEAEKVRDEL